MSQIGMRPSAGALGALGARSVAVLALAQRKLCRLQQEIHRGMRLMCGCGGGGAPLLAGAAMKSGGGSPPRGCLRKYIMRHVLAVPVPLQLPDDRRTVSTSFGNLLLLQFLFLFDPLHMNKMGIILV